MHSPMANNEPNTTITMLREYRKGNWTLQETMILIEAKKSDEERRTKSSASSSGVKTGAGELRWKWVEDYCWRKGCLRSQNQCNDKWDNLMRDFKRVRDHERRVVSGSGNQNDGNELRSYWVIDKVQRKERSLPSNMLKQVYEALVDVVERRSGGFKSSSSSNINTDVVKRLETQTQAILLQPVSTNEPFLSSLPPTQSVGPQPVAAAEQLHYHLPLPHVGPINICNVAQAQAQAQTTLLQHVSNAPFLPLPPPQSAGPPPEGVAEQPHCHMPLPAVDCDTSEHSDSPAKRRRKGEKEGERASTSTTNNIVTEISKSAFLIAEAIQACDERQESRHRELLGLHQKRVQIEESKVEATRQGVNRLVDAFNNLANSILDLLIQTRTNLEKKINCSMEYSP